MIKLRIPKFPRSKKAALALLAIASFELTGLAIAGFATTAGSEFFVTAEPLVPPLTAAMAAPEKKKTPSDATKKEAIPPAPPKTEDNAFVVTAENAPKVDSDDFFARSIPLSKVDDEFF